MTATFRSLLLDSSVVVKWFRNEIDSDKALAIQAEFLRGGLDIQIGESTFYEAVCQGQRRWRRVAAKRLARVTAGIRYFESNEEQDRKSESLPNTENWGLQGETSAENQGSVVVNRDGISDATEKDDSGAGNAALSSPSFML